MSDCNCTECMIGMIIYCFIMFLLGWFNYAGFNCFILMAYYITDIGGGTLSTIGLFGLIVAFKDRREFKTIINYGIYFCIGCFTASVVLTLMDYGLQIKEIQAGDNDNSSIFEDHSKDKRYKRYQEQFKKGLPPFPLGCIITPAISGVYALCGLCVTNRWGWGR